MKYVIRELVAHYHEVELSDELDIMNIINKAKSLSRRCDTGYEAIEQTLALYEDKYGFEYNVRPNYCGTDIIDIEPIEESY